MVLCREALLWKVCQHYILCSLVRLFYTALEFIKLLSGFVQMEAEPQVEVEQS